MRLHENKTLFEQAIRFTSDQMQILPIYVEKDYWVTFALFTIFNSEIGNEMVFKGGTALSKCFNIIERFSEDIDLVALRHKGESNNQLTTKIRTISSVLNSVLPEVTIDGLTQKKGMNRKTVHSYSKEFKGDFGQVRDVIVVEAAWLGYYEPYTTKNIVSFVGKMMLDNNQNAIASENGLLPFSVSVLDPTRTICEKIMSLVRFSYTEHPIDDLKKKIRHAYDLHQLLRHREYADFLKSSAFDEMLLKVANDDAASFKNNNHWLKSHPNNALIFNRLDEIWDDLAYTYNNDFRNLVYGKLPQDTEVFATLGTIKERMNALLWELKF